MDRIEVLRYIRESFDDNELRELCFRLNVNYEDLSGENRAAKARELVALCERRERLTELESTAQQLINDYTSGQHPRPVAPAANAATSGGVTFNANTNNPTREGTGRHKIPSGPTPTPPPLPPTPPRPPDHFTGREADLDKFTRLLTSGQSVAITALHGLGGIGKTSLAQKLAEQLGLGDREGRPYFPGGVLWWTLGPTPDVITALDVWARHVDAHIDLSSLPTPEMRAEAVRPLLAKLGKLCVIIDDVWDAPSFNVLKSAIPAGNPVLMTTRDADLAKTLRCRVERIDALSDDEAVDLLVKLLGPLEDEAHPSTSERAHAEQNEVESKHARPSAQDAYSAAIDIAHLTGGLPLALELIAGLADSPDDLPALAQRLKDKSPLDVLKRGTTREQSIETCFTLSYEHLDAELQWRFAALGVFALASFDRAAIAAVWRVDEKKPNNPIAKLLARFRNKPSQKSTVSVDDAISALVRRSLLLRVIPNEVRNLNATDETPAEYTQHALLHDYALRLLKAEANPHPTRTRPPFAKDANRGRAGDGGFLFHARHADYYRTFAEKQNWRAVEHAFDQIEHGWRWVQKNAPDQVIGYMGAAQNFLRVRGRPFESINWLNAALTLTRAVNDRGNEGVILNNLGQVYDSLGQQDKALEYYVQALDIHREAGNRTGKGVTFNNLGFVYDDLGQKDKALVYYTQALDIHRKLGDRLGEGIALNNLGTMYRDLGQKDKALRYYERALGILREVGDRADEGATLHNLGEVYRTLGQPDKALEYYEQALDTRREVGDRVGEGQTLNGLGTVYADLGQQDKALESYEQALVIQRDAEHGERHGEGITLWNMGYLFEKIERLPEAVEVLQAAVIALRECSSPQADGAQRRLDRVRAKLQGNE
ncbi:MAG: tetratricopeptide repeat protein [Thermoflexales bacterium]|nr:tetratricopeptide repeat protein [Thermoflexales bacterium]